MKLSVIYALLASTSASARVLRGRELSSDGPAETTPSAAACIDYLGGSLNVDQLRWAYSSYSLAELKKNGWDFGANSVPNPDLISETRFWSEYCTPGDTACLAVCPAHQVLIAGPPPGTPAYDKFKEIVFTGPGETHRFQGGGIWNPYYTIEREGFPVDDLVAAFTKDNLEALTIMDPALYADHDTALSVMPVIDDPFGGALVMVYPKVAQPKPSAAKACVDYLGGLNTAQLRWMFSSYSLAQLKANGWDFGSNSVPNPDLISETRFWSELCEPDDEACAAVCPPVQVLIAGPPEGSYIYEAFKALVFTGPDETFRFQGGGIWSPYYTLPLGVKQGPEWIKSFAEDNSEAVSLYLKEDLGDNLVSVPVTDDPFSFLMVPIEVAVPKAVPDLQSESCIEALGGSLNKDQLRWAFSSYSLAELKANGWDFGASSVPNPDLISETRFWSELCGDASCKDACPAVQIKIAGPASGAVYDAFATAVFTGPGETFRQATPGDLSTEKIIDPYYGSDDIEDVLAFTKTFPETLTLMSVGDFMDNKVSLSATPIDTNPFGDAVEVVYKRSQGAAESCVDALGGLNTDQLRWSFSSYSLGELKANGWDFGATSVPNPDLISETRFWSELCGDASCADACPATQVKIAGPGSGATYDKFSSIVFTGEGETYRESSAGDSTDKIIDPYFTGDYVAYAHMYPSSLAIMDSATFAASGDLSAVAIAGSPFDKDVIVAHV